MLTTTELNELTKLKDKAVSLKGSLKAKRHDLKVVYDNSLSKIEVIKADISSLDGKIKERQTRQSESKTESSKKSIQKEIDDLTKQKADKEIKLNEAVQKADEDKAEYEAVRDSYFEAAEKADDLLTAVGQAKIDRQSELSDRQDKAYNTVIRTTDMDLFRKAVPELSDSQLIEAEKAFNDSVKKIQPTVSLLNNWYLKGEMSVSQYDKLSEKFPNIKGIGHNKTDDKTGKTVRINPSAVKQTEPDNLIQILKLLSGSNLSAVYKKPLIEALTAYNKAAGQVLNSADKTEAEKLKAVEAYDKAKLSLDNITAEISSRTDMILKAKSLSGRLLEIAEIDINIRVKKYQSVIDEKRSRIKEIQAETLERQKGTKTVSFNVDCAELGIKAAVKYSADDIRTSPAELGKIPEKVEPVKTEPKLLEGQKAVELNA